MLLFSVGVAFLVSLLLSASALFVGARAKEAIQAGRPGRLGQARAAMTVGKIGFGLAILAGVVWLVLVANDVTPQDLQDALEKAVRNRR